MQTKNFDQADRLAKQLSVNDGTRAAYHTKRVEMLKTPKDKLTFLKEQERKGILNSDVWAQMPYSKNTGKN